MAIKISAIIACYRDAPAVPFMYKRLVSTFRKIKVDYEIIFINDASPDNAEEVLTKLARRDRRVVVVNHARNFGTQAGFTSGMTVATGDAVVFLDGDMQDPPEIIEQFYTKWREGFDVVYGVRVKREATLVLQICYKLFYRVFHKLSYIRIPVDAGDFSLIDRRVVDVLLTFPERDRFLRGLRAWVGFRQVGVPYIRPERMFGVTTNNWHRNLGWARKGIFSFSYVPLELIMYLSWAIVALSFVGIIIQLIFRFAFPDTPAGFTTLIILILFMGGVQLLGLSILGEYIGKIFEEVKQRPLFVVRSILNDPRKKRRSTGR